MNMLNLPTVITAGVLFRDRSLNIIGGMEVHVGRLFYANHQREGTHFMPIHGGGHLFLAI